MNEEPTQSPLASYMATDGVRTEASSPGLSICPFCQANEPQALWPCADTESYRLVRCRRCELVYTVPSLDPKQMLPHYGENYYGRRNVRFNIIFESLVTWFRRRRAAKIAGYLKPGRVLDVGCGRGHILSFLKAWGWDPHGVELNATAALHARDMLGLDVTVGSFNPDHFPNDYFDAVVFWHVLEHLPNVAHALKGAVRILKPRGLLVIAVPNIGSWQAQMTKYHWFHLDLPRHYVHFSAVWLRSQLEGLGMEIREVSHFAFEQNPYGWIQSVLNWCGFRKNLLYDILKNGSARTIANPIHESPFQAMCCLLGFVFLLPCACFMLIPECIFRRGATIELYATRRNVSGA